jgi:predicted small secreted protein
MRKLVLWICPLLMVASILTGCNTTAGAGQDIQQTGQTVSNAAYSAAPK